MLKVGYMEKLYALIGHPVGHSISPVMHNGAFERMGINGHYLNFEGEPQGLKTTLEALKVLGCSGFNVTIPYKEAVIEHLDACDQNAKAIGAVNTVVCLNNQWLGYNTDIYGFQRALATGGVSLKDKKVCVFGHGGSARAVVYACLQGSIKSLDIFSRDTSKMNSWFKDLDASYPAMTLKAYDAYKVNNDYDLMINTTPLGMSPDTDRSIVDTTKAGHKETVFFDLIYNPWETLFLKGARLTDRKTINGLDMLIYQGLKALELWFPNDQIQDNWTRADVLDTLRHLL